MGQSKSVTEQKLPAWQENFLTGTVMPVAQDIADAEFTGYGGSFAPGMSGYTTQAGQTYGQIAGMTPQDYAARTQQNFDAMRANVLDPQVRAMARKRAQDITGEEANIARAGAFGSRRDVYQGEAQGAYEANVADLLAQGYSAAQAQTMAQLGAQQAGAAGLAGVGAAETALASAELAGRHQEFLREQGDPYRRMQGLLGFGQGSYGGTGTETYKPGLFDYMTATGQILSGLP